MRKLFPPISDPPRGDDAGRACFTRARSSGPEQPAGPHGARLPERHCAGGCVAAALGAAMRCVVRLRVRWLRWRIAAHAL
jgi:hypothetical protein